MASSGNVKTAAICGLFCETCPQYPAYCEGCLSDKLAPHCQDCKHGFRDCAREKGVTRCFECKSFPCERLEKFRHVHIVNGISHHEKVVEDLQYMKDFGLERWVARQQEENRCSKCGSLILWHEKYTHTCRT
jgi:Protein of unknown function (DUF3795)